VLGRKGEAMTTAERRKFMRFDTAMNGSYEVIKGAGKGSSEVRNLSREGIQVLVDRELDKGTEVGLHLNVPGDNMPIFACAEVAWNKRVGSVEERPYAIGMKFTKIDRFDKARLLDYVYTTWLKFLKREESSSTF